MLKRAREGTFHKIRQKHSQRHVDEFVGRHNFRHNDKVNQLALFARAWREEAAVSAPDWLVRN